MLYATRDLYSFIIIECKIVPSCNALDDYNALVLTHSGVTLITSWYRLGNNLTLNNNEAHKTLGAQITITVKVWLLW